jgi:hypothetical protein
MFVTGRRNVAKFLQVLLQILVFFGVFALAVKPSWRFMEKMWTKDFSSRQGANDHTFAVLVRQLNGDGHYAVALYPDVEDGAKLVTDFTDGDVALINRDLRASISAHGSNYIYFKVLNRGEGYTDVQLELPPKGDYWSKNSYRIQGGQAYLLRDMQFGPFFGLLIAILSALAGGSAMLCCNRALRLYPRPS